MYLFPVYLFTYFLFTCLFTYFLFTYLFTFNGHTLLSRVAGLCTSENCKNHVVGLLSIYYLVPFSIYLTSNVGVTLKISVRDRLRWWIMVSIDTAYVTSS